MHLLRYELVVFSEPDASLTLKIIDIWGLVFCLEKKDNHNVKMDCDDCQDKLEFLIRFERVAIVHV